MLVSSISKDVVLSMVFLGRDAFSESPVYKFNYKFSYLNFNLLFLYYGFKMTV